MAISGFGNSQNNLKLTTTSKALNLNETQLKAKEIEQPKAQPSAVWVGDGYHVGNTLPGDVIIDSEGRCYRHCIDKNGRQSLKRCSGPNPWDYETDRGNLRWNP